MFKLNKSPAEYHEALPFPNMVDHHILNEQFAYDIQQEILNIPDGRWDRYDNPFEKKYTLRDKNNLPPKCNELFNFLSSQEFIKDLSNVVGYTLYADPYKHWHGIHKYKDGDFLDIHCDAGIHPISSKRKHITLGIYLSKNWEEINSGHLELWTGTDNKLMQIHTKILPTFNTLIIFDNVSNSWHGNPEPVVIPNDESRIFLTVSYLSDCHDKPFTNLLKKARFINRPNDIIIPLKELLRSQRSDPNTCASMYISRVVP
jgi:Rps23 Pro-64 3,4-dihydroxylase Tpa1-like proline 4-hydroxylase